MKAIRIIKSAENRGWQKAEHRKKGSARQGSASGIRYPALPCPRYNLGINHYALSHIWTGHRYPVLMPVSFFVS